MHRLAYLARPELGALVHTHPPYCTALCAAGFQFETVTTESAYYFPKGIPLLPLKEPGSIQLAEEVRDSLMIGYDALLLSKHGLVTVGKDLHKAVELSIAAERTAQTYILSHVLRL